jgi:hypothetical protein
MLRTGLYIMSCLTFQAKLLLYRHYVYKRFKYSTTNTGKAVFSKQLQPVSNFLVIFCQ